MTFSSPAIAARCKGVLRVSLTAVVILALRCSRLETRCSICQDRGEIYIQTFIMFMCSWLASYIDCSLTECTCSENTCIILIPTLRILLAHFNSTHKELILCSYSQKITCPCTLMNMHENKTDRTERGTRDTPH